jgi:hypothetical protein
MASRSESLWRHPLLEGLAVLVAILIAFGLEAWWQERSERVAERVYLEALSGELEDARSFFVTQDQALAADIDLAQAVRGALNSDSAPSISDDSVNVLALQLAPVSVQTPPRAALDDLISSGGIGLVQSDVLRRAVASYVQALESDARTQDATVDHWLTHLTPYRYLHSTVNIEVPLAPSANLPVTVDRDAYVRDRYYANLLSARVLRTADVRTSHQSALEEVDRLLGLLRAMGINSAS